MINDIFSAFINRKKIMTLKLAETLFKYTVNDKNKLNKTLEKIIDIYLKSFYSLKEEDLSELNNYFSLSETNDILLKETLLSTIYFYKQNNLEEKIENDIGTIIILSNIIYLANKIGDISKIEEDISKYINNVFIEYKSKLRIKNNEIERKIKDEITEILKLEFSLFKKFFKSINDLNFNINIEKIIGYNQGYLVNYDYNIKMLSKYSKKEIEATKINKNVDIDLEIISIELVVINIIKDIITEEKDTTYFIPIQLQCFEKSKYKLAIQNIMKDEIVKRKIVFVFEYSQIKGHQKTINLLRQENYFLAVNKVNDIKLSKNAFDNINYVFVSPDFLDIYKGYVEIWKAKKIEFIVSGDY